MGNSSHHVNSFRVRGCTIYNYLRIIDINQDYVSLNLSLKLVGRISVGPMSLWGGGGRRGNTEKWTLPAVSLKGPQKCDSRGLGVQFSGSQCLVSFLEALSLILNMPCWHTWKKWRAASGESSDGRILL